MHLCTEGRSAGNVVLPPVVVGMEMTHFDCYGLRFNIGTIRVQFMKKPRIRYSQARASRANLVLLGRAQTHATTLSLDDRRRASSCSRFERAKMLHEYAESHQGEFPTSNEVHPEYREWKWGRWILPLLQSFLDDTLDEETKNYMESSVYWMSRINQLKKTREKKVDRVPIPAHFEKAKLLHDYAEIHRGEFPAVHEEHPEYPEWKWGTWVSTLLKNYMDNSLDERTQSFMKGSDHWSSRIDQLKRRRESRVGKVPLPDNYQRAKLLHEYADSHQGSFPKLREVHPELPEWKWGFWVKALLKNFLDNTLDEETKAFMEESDYWSSRIEELIQLRESKIGKLPTPGHYKKAKLLHEYAERHQGKFPTQNEIHPKYSEWKWGTWPAILFSAYFNDNLDEKTVAFMESSPYWRSRMRHLEQLRNSKAGTMPSPNQYGRAKLLHEYAEKNNGEFPTRNEVHPKYPEWKWGSWVTKMLQEYLDGDLDINTKTYMERSAYWSDRIENLKEARESKVGTMPIPAHYEKVKMLHDYAEGNHGEFPYNSQVHPEFPEWKWGGWVYNLLSNYMDNTLDERTKAFMEGSDHWKRRIQQRVELQKSREGQVPAPISYEKVKMLHEYAENNLGDFPFTHAVHPEYPEWRWGDWVHTLLAEYMNGELDENTRTFMENSDHWMSRIQRRVQIREKRAVMMPIPENNEKVKMLHDYAEQHDGVFPKEWQVHPEYPEWRWGEWSQNLMYSYFDGSLDKKTKKLMEGSVHWKSWIERIKKVRKEREGKVPNPANYDKARLLHEYAESNRGDFPPPTAVHPEVPEWNWGMWVSNLLAIYLSGGIDQDTIDFMENSPYWRFRIKQLIIRRRETVQTSKSMPSKPKQARMLHLYAENNDGKFPSDGEIHPEYPKYRRSQWVVRLVNDYLVDALDNETRKIMDSSVHWQAKIQERRKELRRIKRRNLFAHSIL